MISILTEWLKEIIVVVLLAVFLDLILPNSQLQRYVKLVMGLLILMTMLSPVLRLLNHDFSLQMLADYGWQTRESAAGWEEVEQERDKLAELQEQQSVAYLQQQIAARIRQQVERQYGAEVKEVGVYTVHPRGSPQSGPPVLSAVEIVLYRENGETTAATVDAGRSRPVAPIQPVSIADITVIAAHSYEEESGAAQPAPPAETGDDMLADIAKDIANTWDLDPGSVTVRYYAG